MNAALESLSLCVSGFGATSTLSTVLNDWFAFLGGRPGEVVYVDGGSPARDTRRLAGLVQRGLITRLELIDPRSWENHFDRCYIQEYRSGALASREHLMFIKPDTLPLRRGGDGWLREDLEQLHRPDVFAITNAHLIDPPEGEQSGYLVHRFASLNFSLMRRDRFHAAMREQAGAFIDAGFRGDYPAHIRCEERYRRALVEWCWAQHCERHALKVLARREDRDWMIFHINKKGRKLLSIRRAMHAGRGVEAAWNKPKGLYRPPPGGLKRIGQGIENTLRKLRRGG